MHLLRITLTDMLAVSCCRQVFGGNATKDKVREELMTYSDYNLHAFALGNKKHFQKYVLPQDAVFDSAKCCRLRDMLLELKAKGSRWVKQSILHSIIQSMLQ